MEHNELDKLFKKKLGEQLGVDQESKEHVWSRLEIHHSRNVLPVWKIAATILFLLLSGSLMYIQNLRSASVEELAASESRYLALKQDFDKSIGKVRAQAEKQVAVSFDKAPANEIPHLSDRPVILERKIYVTDTIYIEIPAEPQRELVYQRDTVFIRKDSSTPDDELESPELAPSRDELWSIRNRKPSSIEFVFQTEPDTTNEPAMVIDPSMINIRGKTEKSKGNKGLTFVTFSN